MTKSTTPSNLSASHILVVEDEREFAQVLCSGLKSLGHQTTHARNLGLALEAKASNTFDLILLDLEVAEQDGLTLLRKMRGDDDQTPVIIMTGSRVSATETATGLNLGADDYLTKPFSFEVLNARINAVLRRSGTRPNTIYRLGNLEMNLLTRSVLCNQVPLDLTSREWELLAQLIQHPGEAQSRELLLREVWKDTPRSNSLNNTLDVHISRLRKKLGEAHTHCMIKTEWGTGFALVAEEA